MNERDQTSTAASSIPAMAAHAGAFPLESAETSATQLRIPPKDTTCMLPRMLAHREIRLADNPENTTLKMSESEISNLSNIHSEIRILDARG